VNYGKNIAVFACPLGVVRSVQQERAKGFVAGNDVVSEKLEVLRKLLLQIWKSGGVSNNEYRLKLFGIESCIRRWRTAGKTHAWIVNQLAAVEDELTALAGRGIADSKGSQAMEKQ
jgi:hypothetical protein